MIFDTVETINGKAKVKRVKTSAILCAAFLCIPVGVFLVSVQIFFGVFLVMIFFPVLLLYPLVRVFFFGGKDSVAAIVTTVVVEELTKSEISKSLKRKNK